MRNLEIESYHCVFPDADPCSPITFQNSPSKHLFSHYCLHISHPFVLSSYSESSYFWFPDFVFTFSLTNCRGDSFILALKYSPPRNISGGKKMFGVHGSTEIFPPTSLSTASFHPALCSGEATQVTAPICFPSFIHRAPDALTPH